MFKKERNYYNEDFKEEYNKDFEDRIEIRKIIEQK